MSDIFLSEDEISFREEIRSFLKDEISPDLIRKMDAEEIEFPSDFVKKCGERGYLGLSVPEEYRGLGKPHIYEVIGAEEIAAMHYSFICAWGIQYPVGSAIYNFGSNYLKENYLRPLVKGELICGEAFTEPLCGSDLLALKSSAVREGDHYLIRGEKRFQMGGVGADFFLVLVRTNPDVAPHKGLSFFLIDREMGITVEEKYKLMGLRGMGATRLGMPGIKIPQENLVGEEGQGWEIFNHLIMRERLGIAGGSVGVARECLNIAAKYADSRMAFKRKIRDYQGISFKIADMVTSVDAARLLTLKAARMMDKEILSMKEVCEAKLFASEVALKVANEALQIIGGIGYTDYYPIERFVRDVRLGTIWTGSSEMMRLIIQDEFFKQLDNQIILSELPAEIR